MSYLATLYEASSVQIAIKAEFLAAGETSLIVAKSSHIEVFKVSRTGIILQEKFPIYGRVIALAAFRPQQSGTDHLLIAIGQVNYKYFTISWDPIAKKPKNEHTAIDFSSPLTPLSDSFMCLSDPGKNMLGLYVYRGKFLAIPQVRQSTRGGKRSRAGPDVGNIQDLCIVRLKELEIIDLKFLFGTSLPVLAVLHKPLMADEMAVNTYELSVKSGEVKLSEWRIRDLKGGQEALFLIPVQPPLKGLFLIGATNIQYINNDGKKTFQPVDPPTVWTTWEMLGSERYILGDEAGGLHLLLLQVDVSDGKARPRLKKIGDASVPETLVHLNQGLLFLGSSSGDSQLIQLYDDEPMVRVQQVLDNIGPMVDFRVMDLDYSRSDEGTRQYSPGHIRFLSASGGHKQGHLRNIRSGVGLDDLGVLGEMRGVRGLWSLRSIPESSFDDVLVVAFVDETRIFKFGDTGDIEELDEFMGFALDQRTVIAHNAVGGRFLQVTSTAVRLVDAGSGTTTVKSCPDDGLTITMASANQDLLIYATGPTLVLLDLTQNLKECTRKTFENEISCLNIPASPSRICAVGFWNMSLVLILSLESFSILSQEVLSIEDSIATPRSLLLARILENGPPTLLVALGDGSIFTFSINETTCALYEKKNIILGTQPIRFQPILRGDGKTTVFATCDHPSIIYGSDGRIVYASVTADKSTYVTSFNSHNFPDAVVIASEDDLKLSVVDPLRTMHIQSLPVGDVVRRIAYSKEKNNIAVVTVSKALDPRTGDDLHTSYIRLIDSATFSVVDSYKLHELELAESLTSGRICSGNGLPSEGFLVGTAFPGRGEKEESEKGRIIIFNVSETKRIKLTASYDTLGMVSGIKMVGEGKFVAAVGREVELFALEYSDFQSKSAASKSASATGCTITTLAKFSTHSAPLDVATYNGIIAVGDFMHGPSILECIEDKESKKTTFAEVARAYNHGWLAALELLDEKTVFCADTDGNLVVWQRQLSGVTEDDRKQLRQIASIKIGEYVNRIRRITGQTLAGSKVQPKAYFSTVDGSMFLLGEIQASEIDLLINLQTNLANAVKGLGGLNFLTCRAMSTSLANSNTEPIRFVDGNFIEAFLDLPEDVATAVVKGNGKAIDDLGVSVQDVVDILETLKRLR
ncbi:hypothetical protein C7212DRAFT_277045 [Tuber magnatum]|uniref:DNA damage-binding protein 1 n=1 Tax=Tuber magnatum TaxID=42249 RepID=A0A317STI1_9PEZI|nr:hypothetical protein C7212DRAFT_277045 [Tuber magnatum]